MFNPALRNQEPFYLHPHKDPPTSQHLGAVDYLDVRAVRVVEFYLKTIVAKQLRMTINYFAMRKDIL